MSEQRSDLHRHHHHHNHSRSTPSAAAAAAASGSGTSPSRPAPIPSTSSRRPSASSSHLAGQHNDAPTSPDDPYDFDTAMSAAASNAHASTSSHVFDTGYMTDESNDSQATEVEDRGPQDDDDDFFWDAHPHQQHESDAVARGDMSLPAQDHYAHGVPDSDLEELLAWGSGEIELEGMPTAGASDARSVWYEDQPDFLGIEIATDDDWSEDESDDSMDSIDEAEQFLAIQSGFASDSDGSIGDGDTTDSLDDTDHDALVRFGIEEAEPDTPQQSSKSSAKQNNKKSQKQAGASSPSSPDQQEPLPPPPPSRQRAPLAPEPLLGCFSPQPSSSSTSASASTHAIIIATEKALVISPFSIKKIRKLVPASVLKQRSRRSSEASSSYTSTGTTTSTSAHPMQQLDLPSLMVPEEGDEQGEIYMELDLDDILEASALQPGTDFDILLQESEEATDAETTQLNDGGVNGVEAAFERWNRIPIGAFRRARQDSIQSIERTFSPETAVRRGSRDQNYMHVPGTVYTSARSFAALNAHSPARLKGKRLKVSRRDAIALSPILCPVQTSAMPSSVRSHKQRRADKKQTRKSKSSITANARSSQSPVKQGAQLVGPSTSASDMLLPPSSTVPMTDSTGFSSSGHLSQLSMAPVSPPVPFSSFAPDGEVPPLDLPEAAALFGL